jgi:hypothetical protein
MSKLTEKLKSPHVQISLAAGASILATAIASRWLLPEPMGYLAQAFAPFLAVIYESVYSKHPDSKVSTTWYWVVAIVVATALVIVLHMF